MDPSPVSLSMAAARVRIPAGKPGGRNVKIR